MAHRHYLRCVLITLNAQLHEVLMLSTNLDNISNITDEAVQKYIKEQAEESRKEDSRSTAL